MLDWRTKYNAIFGTRLVLLRTCFKISETHDGVQDMACDTFIKIAQKCRRYFVQVSLIFNFLVLKKMKESDRRKSKVDRRVIMWYHRSKYANQSICPKLLHRAYITLIVFREFLVCVRISVDWNIYFIVTQVQVGEVMPFIEEILNNISTIVCDLQPQQVHTFYEAVGFMISSQTVSVTLFLWKLLAIWNSSQELNNRARWKYYYFLYNNVFTLHVHEIK